MPSIPVTIMDRYEVQIYTSRSDSLACIVPDTPVHSYFVYAQCTKVHQDPFASTHVLFRCGCCLLPMSYSSGGVPLPLPSTSFPPPFPSQHHGTAVPCLDPVIFVLAGSGNSRIVVSEPGIVSITPTDLQLARLCGLLVSSCYRSTNTSRHSNIASL